jgi:hypothetical protein
VQTIGEPSSPFPFVCSIQPREKDHIFKLLCTTLYKQYETIVHILCCGLDSHTIVYTIVSDLHTTTLFTHRVAWFTYCVVVYAWTTPFTRWCDLLSHNIVYTTTRCLTWAYSNKSSGHTLHKSSTSMTAKTCVIDKECTIIDK